MKHPQVVGFRFNNLGCLLCTIAIGSPLLIAADPGTTVMPGTSIATRSAISVHDVDAAIAGFQAYYAQGRFHYAAQVRELSQGVYGLATSAERLAQAKDLLARMATDGTWPDIDYADQNRTYWKVQWHANRAVLLAAAALTADESTDRAALSTAADRAITTWRERKFRNTNWWYNDFGAPQALGAAGILLGDALSAENRKFLIELTLRIGRVDQYDQVGGGGNQVWHLSRNLMGALLSRDPVWSRTLADAIWMQTECPALVPPERRASGVNAIEGVQPDASMHQHGTQMQFGNYGLSYAIDTAAWAVILRQSSLAMPAERVAAFRWYLLEGQDWVYWRGRIDPSCFGRRFCPRVSTSMYDMVRQPMTDLAEIDPSAAEASRAFLARNQGDTVNDRTGVRWFWRSDYGVVRNEGFFASVRLHSSHAIGWESCNGENLQGQQLGNGTTLLSTRGGEYDEIYPVWDWTRLPGITTAASAALQPQLAAAPSTTAALSITATPIQAGGVGDGRHGCIAYQHADKASGISARKAWFMDRDALVFLGAGIVGAGKGQPITSVNQCLGRGPVRISVGGTVQELPAGTLGQVAAEWIEHDGLRYEFPAGGSLLAGTTTQTGAWPSVSTAVTSPLELQSLPVFSLLINHGHSPSAGSYAYAVRPVGTNTPYRIVSNTPDLQAVAWDERHCAVVFWQPGTITWATGHTLQANAPCLVDLNGERVSVSDPTWNLTRVDLTIDGTSVPVNLPTAPGYAGSTVTISYLHQ